MTEIKQKKKWLAMTAEQRIAAAVSVPFNYGNTSGAHHKQWIIDQMLRYLLREDYPEWCEKYRGVDEDGEPGEPWDEGVAP